MLMVLQRKDSNVVMIGVTHSNSDRQRVIDRAGIYMPR